MFLPLWILGFTAQNRYYKVKINTYFFIHCILYILLFLLLIASSILYFFSDSPEFFFFLILIYFFFLLYYYYFFTLQYCIGFAIHQHASAMCSPTWNPLPPPSPYHPSGSSQCTIPKLPVSCIEPGLVIHFLHDIIHVLMPFSQIITPSLFHRFQKTVL